MLLQKRVARECGVGGEEVVDGVARGFHEGLVVDDGCYAEVEGAALLESLDVSGTPQPEVGFGNLESVGGAAHGADALLRGVAEIVLGHEDAVGLVATASYAAAQLVELREAKALGVLDDHYRGVGNVDADFYDGGSHHDMGNATFETVHLEGFLVGGEASVDHRGLVLRPREIALHHLEAVLQVLEVHLLAFFDERIDDVYLATGVDFFFEEGEDEWTVALVTVEGAHGVAARGQLVDDGAVKVAVEGHGQCARNGCGRHDEDVWWDQRLVPQLAALFDAESVLLVDDNEAEVVEEDVVLDEGVGADEDVDGALGEAFFDFFSSHYLSGKVNVIFCFPYLLGDVQVWGGQNQFN